MLKTLTFTTLASLGFSQETTGGNEVHDGHVFDMVYLQIDGEDYVQFDVRIPNDTWFALNVGGLGMGWGDDMITFRADGDNSSFIDGYSIGWIKPRVDSE